MCQLTLGWFNMKIPNQWSFQASTSSTFSRKHLTPASVPDLMDFRFSNGQILRHAFTNTLGILAVGCMSWYLGPGRLDISGIRADIDNIWQTTTLPWVADIPICARSSCRPLFDKLSILIHFFLWVSCYMDLPPIDGHSKRCETCSSPGQMINYSMPFFLGGEKHT